MTASNITTANPAEIVDLEAGATTNKVTTQQQVAVSGAAPAPPCNKRRNRLLIAAVLLAVAIGAGVGIFFALHQPGAKEETGAPGTYAPTPAPVCPKDFVCPANSRRVATFTSGGDWLCQCLLVAPEKPMIREVVQAYNPSTHTRSFFHEKTSRRLTGGVLGSVGEGIGKGLGDKLGSLVQGAVAGTCDCAHGSGALGSCNESSLFAGNGGFQSDCTKQSSKDACDGQKNIVGKRFCKWTPSKLSTDLGNISKDLDPSNWGKALGLQRRLESNEVAETNAVGNILQTMTKEVGDITEKMGYEVKDGIENSIREVGNAKRGRELSKKKCGNAAGQAACITACASVALIPLCLSDACYGPNGPDFSPECAAKTPFEPFARKGDKWGPMAGYYDKNPDFCKTLVPSKSPFCPGKLVGHCKDDDAECITCCKKVMVQSYADATTSVMGGMGR